MSDRIGFVKTATRLGFALFLAAAALAPIASAADPVQKDPVQKDAAPKDAAPKDAAQTGAPQAHTEESQDLSAMIPSVSLWLYIDAGADSVHAWAARNRNTGSRTELFSSIRDLLKVQSRMEDRIAPSFPKNQPEWLLITDAVADTLTQVVSGFLQRYTKANPEEILTDGRIALEMQMSTITGPPSRLLGFHFVKLANFVYGRTDSLLLKKQVTDRIGIEDGVLRYMADWCNLYQQGHKGPIEVFESRVVQEDWIIARLKDKCGNSGTGTWQLTEQWMAEIPDSSTTPVTFRWAHEYKLKSVKCEGDVRDIYIDLPNYREVQQEVARKSKEGKLDTSVTGKPK